MTFLLTFSGIHKQEFPQIRLPSHWSQVKSSTWVENVKLVFQIFVHCIVPELLIIFILWLSIKLLNFCLDYLMGVKWHLLVILICIFFITNEVEPLLHVVIDHSCFSSLKYHLSCCIFLIDFKIFCVFEFLLCFSLVSYMCCWYLFSVWILFL